MYKIRTIVLFLILSLGLTATVLPVVFASPHADIDAASAWNIMTSGLYPNVAILDVRNQSEYDTGYIPRAILIPLWQLPTRLSEIAPYKNSEIIVYCRTGGRSHNASLILDANGFTKVYDMTGGFNSWNSSGYPVSTPAIGYTETAGKLNGTHFVVRIPNSWNGMLSILCRGYSHDPVLDARIAFYNGSAASVLAKGVAYAASSYGAGGFCVSKAVNTTYELTNYLIDTFHITGKVFLYGVSMGGNIALLLAEKYPDLYSGVLELAGNKDAKLQYEHLTLVANMNVTEIRAYFSWPPTVPDAMVLSFKNFCATAAADIIAEMGGTPLEKPEAYEELSPTHYARIRLPVITIHGTGDAIVPLLHTTLYQTAVAGAGRAFLYRVYTTPPALPGTGHVDANVAAQVGTRSDELVAWSNSIGEYRDWTVVPSDGRIYIMPPQSMTGIVGCQQIGTWDEDYYGRLGKTTVDAAKPAIDECISNCR